MHYSEVPTSLLYSIMAFPQIFRTSAMMVINPSPNRPRQRVSPSPIGKDSLLRIGDITTSRGNGMKFGDRKDQLQHSVLASPQATIENYLPKREHTSRNQCHRKSSISCKKVAATLTLIVSVLKALSLFMHNTSIFNNTSSTLLELNASRSLTLQKDSINHHKITETLHKVSNSDNPSPRIVWLMSFPNR